MPASYAASGWSIEEKEKYRQTRFIAARSMRPSAPSAHTAVSATWQPYLTAHQICDMYGVDTISCGATIAFAMECFEKGIITKEVLVGST